MGNFKRKFDMSDAQIDGGDRGGAIEDGVSNRIGVENEAEAVRWYGIFSWLMVSFFDGQFMRAVFRDLVAVSLLGPFFAYWYYIAQYFLYAEAYTEKLNYWLWGIFFVVHSLL